MLKVLLVDDEPFIIQGLKVLIDWEQEGYMIAGTASNGKEAYDFLKKESVDLIIADIQMPVMTGLDLQEAIRKENLSNAYFVILSGYADFEYARRALQNECTDYILKPVDRDMLLKLLNRVSAMRDEDDRMRQKNNKMEKAYLDGVFITQCLLDICGQSAFTLNKTFKSDFTQYGSQYVIDGFGTRLGAECELKILHSCF